MDDFGTKEGAAKLVARLQSIYRDRVMFRIEQDKYGVWGVRSDMIRGIPRDGEPYKCKEPFNVGKERKSTKPNPNGGAAVSDRISKLKKQLTDKGIRWNGEDSNVKDVSGKD